ncbi:MAG: protease inhibitor I42 family protein [Dehalococcoidales bacterium]|nr:protease inhibitor I42 family protein [Dehalococcoidales bacterium]
MKKVLLLLMLGVMGAGLVAGCAGAGRVYTDSGQTINVNAGQEFIIAIGSNPTTGYSWQESHDETMLQLVSKTYQEGEQSKKGIVGGGGIDYFRFKALKIGETKINMSYKRPWETAVVDQKVFTVNIK